MVLTFGSAQVYTSEKMRRHPRLGKIFNAIFGYTNIGNYARFNVFKKLIQKVPLIPEAKILDLGSGYGEFSISLAKALPQAQIHALDIDEKRINSIQAAVSKCKIENIVTHHDDTENLKEGDFDFIFSIDVFEHILPEKMPFKAAYDRLKVGGYLLIKIPNVNQRTILPEQFFEEHKEWLKDEHIGQVYNLSSLYKRFVTEGFKIVHASYSDGWLSRLGWELAYLGKKFGLVTQLISLPIAKTLIHLDRIFHRPNWGNAIQVIGIKIQSSK